MYLSKLEVVGFKSFAQKTVFNLSEGIAAIVGPNGCGKTNVVDAIRWVLGEQKTAVLRSDLMENVIFNGTKTRKPLGMAEVSLTLQNNKNKLPLEYTEVTITRRLFRSGDSQYLLNNTQCRLRDITDLFMDTGMGANSYSVIELKMVEAILSGKPEERRSLFEEAAGVVRYKLRRKEANRKLQNVQADLTRVEDIISEVRKLVNSLKRQAAKTRRYNKLMEQHKEVDLNILKFKYQQENAYLNERQEKISKVKSEKKERELRVKESEDNLSEIEKKSSALEKEYIAARDRETELERQTAQKTKDIAIAQEKVQSRREKQRRINSEIENLNQEISSTTQNLKETRHNIEYIKKEIFTNGEALDENSEMKASAYKKLSELREHVNQRNEQIISVENRIRSLKQSERRLLERKESIDRKIKSDSENIERLNKEISELEYSLQEKVSLDIKLEGEIKDAEDRLKHAQRRQEELNRLLDEQRSRINELDRTINSKKNSLELLSGLIDSGETAKYLLKEKNWKPAGEKTLLSELAGADEKYRLAVNAALGEAAHFFVADNKNDAESAFALLKQNDKGKVSFLCRDRIPEMPPPEAAPEGNGFYGWASEIIRVDDNIRSAVRAITGETLIVEDIENAFKAVEEKIAERAVTLKGELVGKEGIYRGGSVTKTEGRTIGKRERIKKLKKEILALQEDITAERNVFSKTKEELSNININALNGELRSKESEKNKNSQELSKLKYRRESIENNISLLEQNSKSLQEERLSIEKENTSSAEELGALENDLKIFNEKLAEIKKDLSEAEDNYEQWADSTRQSELKAVKLKSELENMEKEVERLEQSVLNAQNKIRQEKDEYHNAETTVSELTKNIERFTKELEEIKKLSGEAEAKRKFLKEELDSLQEQVQSYSNDLKRLRESYRESVDNVHKLELELSEHQTQRRNLLSKVQEKHEINLEENNTPLPGNFDFDDSQTELLDLKEKLNTIGSVNFLALEEFEEQQNRLDFYEKQMKDLTDSEKNLQETIEEINRTAEQKFLETFDDIQKNFQDLFKTLFGNEGEASLHLAEGNPLEANIEIIARPPGKRPHAIDMLSGGEKTLTAIALLFGIYLVKPSPFCILDEVDAPLDDSNIDKFIKLIRRFSEETQFLIVTHNKRSMAAADTMYGITMQEEGISKVVSAKLSETAV